MHNTTGRAVPPIWLLLNSQSTVELIANVKMLVNISKVRVKYAIRVHCNSGIKIVDRVGDLPGYRTVCYEPTGVTNILSMSMVTPKFRVVFDSEGENFLRMVLQDREVRFQLSPNRLYYFGVVDRENSVLLLDTVSENRGGFTRRDYEGSQEARQAMHLLGFPSDQYFENMVSSNIIVNFPVTFDDVKNAKLFFGPDITSLKGKSVRRKPASVFMDYV